MTDFAARLTEPLVGTSDVAVLEEFETRLADSSGLAYRVAFSVVRQQQDAEDVDQEAFPRASSPLRGAARPRPLSRLAGPDDLAAGSRSAAPRPAACDVRGGGQPFRRRDDGVLAPTSRQLWQAIDQLPTRLRLVVVLSSIEGHDTREVSSLLSIPAGTVKSRLFEARRELQEALR